MKPDDGMAIEPARVLVTGAGGPAGVAVIRKLREQGHWVLAADASSEAVGLRLGNDWGVIPRGDAPDFAVALAALAQQRACTLLISTVAEEMLSLHADLQGLVRAGLRAWLPSPEAISICIDKWRFAQVLAQAGLPVPDSSLGLAASVPGPWIIKPRFGRGSRDVYAVDDEQMLELFAQRVPQPVVQTRLTGREFTIDVLVDHDGVLAGAVPRWRLETKAGISTRGQTFRHGPLVESVQQLVQAIGLTGPANIQGFVADDGGVAFIEANPRFSGGLPLSLAAGADLVGEYIRGTTGQPVRRELLAFREGVLMLRYFEEIFEG